jgi:hypothetical protein
MSISITTKLHFLLIMTMIGIALYMYLLYKEVRSFEKDINDLRIKVQALNVAQQHPHSALVDVVDNNCNETSCSAHLNQPSADESVDLTDDDDNEDDASVTTNEIKDILTNIQEDEPVESVTPTPPVTEDEKEPVQTGVDETYELKALSESELQTLKYDELRTYLRKQGVNVRGTKQEMIQKILALDATA